MSKKHITAYIFTLWLIVLAAGCNNDVFIDGPALPDSQEVTIEGDGGEVVLRIPVKGLRLMRFGLTSDLFNETVYYDLDGKEVDSSTPVSQIGKMVYDDGLRRIELKKKGGEIKIVSISNPWERGWQMISLDYGYATKYIEITILQGKPLELESVEYDGDMEITDNAEVRTSRMGFTNNGSLPQIYEERPFINQPITTLVDVGTQTSWPYMEKVTMPVPVFENGSWKVREKPEIRLGGDNKTYRSDQVDYKVEVDIPANSSVNIFTDVIYTQATAKGVLNFVNTVLDRHIPVKFTVTAKYPANYEIRVEDKKD